MLNKIGNNKLETYSIFLKNIKNWCIQKEIYSNPLGLLNGVSLSIMCAKIILMYPNVNNYENLFFQFYSTFDWENNIISIYHGKHQKHKKKLMNVYTPFEIPTNTLYNVETSQFEKIKKCFLNPNTIENFFHMSCNYYIMLSVIIKSEETLKNDVRFIESKLKYFTQLNYSIEIHTKCYKITSNRILFFIKFCNDYPDTNEKKNEISINIHNQFLSKLDTSNFFVNIDFVTFENLPQFCL